MSTLPLRFSNGEFQIDSFDCSCGRRHESIFERVVVRPGVLDECARIIGALPGLSAPGVCCLVADENTYEAAGRRVVTALANAGWKVTVSMLGPRDGVVPDEKALGTVLVDAPVTTTLFVSVGSGSITDVTRFVGIRTGTPVVAIATAPSVDAYTSNNSPLTHRGVKETIEVGTVRAVIADTDVLAAAPELMIRSGFGDTVAKLLSRCDWKLSRVVTGEPFCDGLERTVTEAANRCAALASGIAKHDRHAIASLAESLMVSGAGMALCGNSRPASGSEHSLSHFWEMKAAHTGSHAHMHGVKVGVGTVVMAAFWEEFGARLESIDPGSVDLEAARKRRRTVDEIRDVITRPLGSIGEALVNDVTVERLRDGGAVGRRQDSLVASWNRLSEIAAECPTSEWFSSVLKEAGAAHSPSDIGISRDELKETLGCALETRRRYTVLSAAEDLGWLSGIVDAVVARF